MNRDYLQPLVSQPGRVPTRKATAQAVASAIVLVVAYTSRLFGAEVTLDVEVVVSALGVVNFLAAYFVRDRANTY